MVLDLSPYLIMSDLLLVLCILLSIGVDMIVIALVG